MAEIQTIKNLANDIVERFELTKENWETFIEDTDSVNILAGELNGVKGRLMNYEDYKQDYLDGLIDEIDAIVHN